MKDIRLSEDNASVLFTGLLTSLDEFGIEPNAKEWEAMMSLWKQLSKKSKFKLVCNFFSVRTYRIGEFWINDPIVKLIQELGMARADEGVEVTVVKKRARIARRDN